MRRLLAWLSKRFPEQRVVTLAEYKFLHEEVYRLSQASMDFNSRIVQLDAQVKRLNDQAGYVTSKKGSFALER